MKLQPSGPRQPARSFARRGAALILVLSLLALILLLALMTLRTGGDHAVRQRLRADSLEADSLTRLPVNLVLAQLQAGTVDLPPGAGWVSQPGMIRTFSPDKPAENGAPSTPSSPESIQYHRLYSAAVMSSPSFDADAEAASLSQWEEKPSAFTDLNEPIPSQHGRDTVLKYPIAAPGLLAITEGYALLSAAPGSTPQRPLPLPAAWIYVLRDGRLVTPVTSSGTAAEFDEHVVTLKNPVVGRIAFWTDDESCKLNLNTAAEPGLWDLPAANSLSEWQRAENPPGPWEAYRISRHPAFTALSPVLRHFGGGKPGDLQWPVSDVLSEAEGGAARRAQYLGLYQSLIPDGISILADGTIAANSRHLFPGVGEFFYNARRQPNGSDQGFRMTRQDLAQAAFLLTTHSSAPELNPWGQPKIALGMIPANPSERSLADRQLNTCATLPGSHREFIFQRAANWSSPERPGSSQSMTADWSEVPRNRELYSWLQSLTDQEIPGCAASFAGKYGVRSRNQILTSMLDMLRWSTTPDTGLPPPAGVGNPAGFASESAVPLTIPGTAGADNGTRGFGRFPTVSEVAVVFAFTDVARLPDGSPLDTDHDGICDRAAKLRAFLVVKPFIAAAGSPIPSPAFSLRIRRLQHFTIGQGIGLLLPGGNARDRCDFSSSILAGNTASPGFDSFAAQFLQADGQPKELGNRDDPAKGFAFISSADVRIPDNAGQPGSSIRFSGGAIIVDFMEPGAGLTSPKPDDAIHSVEMEFPDLPIPFPSLPVPDFAGGPRPLNDRFALVSTASGPRLPIIRAGDVVRSMIVNPAGPSCGDLRLQAAQREVLFANSEANRALFRPHPDYESPAVMQAHDLPEEFIGPAPNTSLDPATGSPPPHKSSQTSFPAAATNAVGRQGDWESGSGLAAAGPGIDRSTRQPQFPQILTNPSKTGARRQILPFSPVQFGAIPSGVYGDAADSTPRPWQTLLFCPNPPGRQSASGLPGRYDPTGHDHFGFSSPPDHLWLELFWNPVTAPRPLSAGLSTEGKVNLNFQILPWTWLRRSTAMHGALQGVRITAIPASPAAESTAKENADGSPPPLEFRYAVDADGTLAAFEQRFDGGRIFRYASEICEMFLAPKRLAGGTYESPGATPARPDAPGMENLTAWWNGRPGDPADAFEATGDNLRESPYAQLYSRICTQSNVFRVHYRVQTLKKIPGTPPASWQEFRDVRVSDRRGSYRIERRFAPSAFQADPATTSGPASPLHRQFRLVAGNQEPFSP